MQSGFYVILHIIAVLLHHGKKATHKVNASGVKIKSVNKQYKFKFK